MSLAATPALAAQRTVLLDTDDPAASAPWRLALAQEGLGVEDAAGRAERPDAAALFFARSLPEQLARLRERRAREPALPLLVVCRALRDLDHVLALETGADDVVDANLAAPVVAARLRLLWRRAEAAGCAQPRPQALTFGGLSLHLRERLVLRDGSAVPLTEGEFEVLWLLAERAGATVSRLEMLRQVRGLDWHCLDRSIDCRVYRIRAKLGDGTAGAAGQRIRTVRNRGYLFSPAGW